MSNTAFSYLYLNCGSEMVYIIQQRLIAQKICKLKAAKVLDDILIEMFNENFLDETFQCDSLPNLISLKQLFAKIAHCSIMKLNESSLNKLFDLIIMVFKYQLCACTHSTDLIQVTLNHLHSLQEITDKQPIRLLIALARNRFLAGPAAQNAFKIQFTRQTLLNYLISMHVRAAILLKIGVQCDDGRFRQTNTGRVPCSCQLPGKITQFDTKGQIISIQNFSTKGFYEFDPSLTSLGFSIYEKEEELSEKYRNELNELDENNNQIDNDHQNKLQFSKEAQLLSILLGQEIYNQNKEVNLDNELKENLLNKKDSKFWLNIDLELNDLDGLEKPIDTIENNEKNDLNVNKTENEKIELDKLEQAFEHHQLIDNKENNFSKAKLLKIKQDLIDEQSNQSEPKSLLELLDNEC